MNLTRMLCFVCVFVELAGLFGFSVRCTSQTIQVSNSTIATTAGSRMSPLIGVSWTFNGNITLTQMTFSGDDAGWVRAPTLPLTLSAGNYWVPDVFVSIPKGTLEGNYTVQVSSQFTFQGGVQSVTSSIYVYVGGSAAAAGSRDPFPTLQAWIVAYAWLIGLIVALLLTILAVVVMVRRRRRW